MSTNTVSLYAFDDCESYSELIVSQAGAPLGRLPRLPKRPADASGHRRQREPAPVTTNPSDALAALNSSTGAHYAAVAWIWSPGQVQVHGFSQPPKSGDFQLVEAVLVKSAEDVVLEAHAVYEANTPKDEFGTWTLSAFRSSRRTTDPADETLNYEDVKPELERLPEPASVTTLERFLRTRFRADFSRWQRVETTTDITSCTPVPNAWYKPVTKLSPPCGPGGPVAS
jgi:hypothetical protein